MQEFALFFHLYNYCIIALFFLQTDFAESIKSLNNKVFHEVQVNSTDSRIYQYRRQRNQRSELSRKETYFVSQGNRAVRKKF
uniref:Bm13122 n=1 Tax=Brugia malayi TaxID=6279 RepID=A0A1I9G311_BRUMA|nr:Bm13122 [Brugia malayi]